MFSAARSRADDVEDVILGELLGPQQLAAVQVEGQDGIAGFRRWLRKIIACAGVDDSALDVNRGRRPDAGARRAPVLHSRRGFGCGLRLLGNRVGLPDLFSAGRVQRHQGPA